jgi:D-alanyl-D-alanine carboxypeptidase/D-alanyl-D-alanine-endopeptidase (penicillin-binding protein 4)
VQLARLVLALLAAPNLGRLPAAEVDAFLASLDGERAPLAERIARVSSRLVGTRYVRDPLGEGRGRLPDPDPLIDLARVDCLTFVEQVLALAQRRTLRDATLLLQRYRYARGEIDYRQRRHFMELQWLPGIVAEGLLRDVTARIGGEATRIFEREVTRRSYRGAFRVWRRRLRNALPVGTIRLAYVAAADAPRLAARIPPGAILALLRRTPRRSPIAITHVGFVVPGERGMVFRHAIHVAGRVIEEALPKYLARHARDPASLGFHFAEPLPAP